MTKDILFLLIALTALLIILTSTIKEVIDILHVYYSSAAHPGRIRGASEPGPEDYVSLDLKPEELKIVKMIIDKGRFIDDLK